jgi:lipoprotein-releasing system permease protein
MFKPLSFYIGLRYTRAKRKTGFISFISSVSMIGIALGVAVLITVLSVMNGFDQQIRNRIFTMVPHIQITGMFKTLSNTEWHALNNDLIKNKQILGVAPYIEGQGMLTRDSTSQPVMVQGILPEDQNKISALNEKMIAGHLGDLKSGKFGIVLGDELANSLALRVGDKINLMIPKVTMTPIGIVPRYKRFTVVGIFHVGSGFGFDMGYAYINLYDAQKLYTLGNNISGLQIKTVDLFKTDQIAYKIQEKQGYDYQISTWADSYGAFYHAVKMEKTMMFFILILLVAIAAFNLVSSLVMLVNDKQSDIAILRTLGATPRTIQAIFMVQGFVIGVFGTLLGILGGVVLSYHVTAVVNWIQSTFHVMLFTPGVYFVDYLPSQLQWQDVINIASAALIMSFIATIYPAWKASRTQPAEALRYE